MRFWREEEGSHSIEAVLILPLLFWAFMAMVVYWDAFKTKSVNLKAGYTIGDMISRETGPIDSAYVESMNAIYDWLTMSSYPTRLRVSVVVNRLDSDGAEDLSLLWSHGVAGSEPLVDVEVLRPHLPAPAIGEQLIVVETFLDYAPVFRVGLRAQELADVIVTRPRFVPQVLWNGPTS